MTPRQCRAARAALQWSAPDLARMAGVHVNSVSRFENGHARPDTIAKLRAAMEAAGIEFLDDVGIRFGNTVTMG